MHASHIHGMTKKKKKRSLNLNINSFFENSNSTILFKKKLNFFRKFLDLYLMKIHTCFLLEKNFRFVFSENTDMLIFKKKEFW